MPYSNLSYILMPPTKLLCIFMFSSIIALLGCDAKKSKAIDSGQPFWQNIEVNSVLTKEMLEATADDKLEETIISSINSKLNRDLNNSSEVLPTLSMQRQAIYYIYLLEMEVNNGGFDQYYLNSYIINKGDYMFIKKNDALKTIGASKFAGLVQRADKIFIANEKDFDRHINLFEDLDLEFYKLYNEENLNDLKIRFIRNNLAAFIDG